MFFIKKLSVTGNGVRESFVEFSKGLNIITGDSNTGKSMIFNCIDYVFGGNEARLPFDEINTKYDTISLELDVNLKCVKMTRKFKEKVVSIASESDLISSGEYKIPNSNNYDHTLNSVLLKLMGIESQHEIIKNESYEKQKLTWRTIAHLFFMSEDRIISGNSPLLRKEILSKTAILSAIIFLLTGEDLKNTNRQESLKIKNAKKSALKEYIFGEIALFSQRTAELRQEINNDFQEELEKKIENTVKDMEVLNNKIMEGITQNRDLLSEIDDKNKLITEKNSLLQRYYSLKSQYKADIKRLNFIVDGHLNYEHKEMVECPFCNTNVPISDHDDYLESSLSSYRKISFQLNDLNEVITCLKEEIEELENDAERLMTKKILIENEIEIKLKPILFELEKEISNYKIQLEKNYELQIIKDLCDKKTIFLQQQEVNKSDDSKYDPKDYLGSFADDFGKYLKKLLEKMHADNLNSVYFSLKDMDVVINGKLKSTNGKGYRAFYNSVILIAFIRYLNEKGKYKPSILLLDSPILSLKLNDKDDQTDASIKKGLFEFLDHLTNEIQTIVFENETPDISYESANIIKFTKNNGKERSGFLLDYFDTSM